MDALLAVFARHLGVAPEAARPALYALVDRLRAALDEDGRATLDGVGTWARGPGGVAFEPDPVLLAAVNRAYVGLAPVRETPPAAPAAAPPPGAPPEALAAAAPFVPLVVPAPVSAGAPPPADADAFEGAPDAGDAAPPFAAFFGEEPEDDAPTGADEDAFDVPSGWTSVPEPAPDAPEPFAADPFADEPGVPTDGGGGAPEEAPDDDLDALIAGVWAPSGAPPALDAPGPSYEEAEFAVVEPGPEAEPAPPEEAPVEAPVEAAGVPVAPFLPASDLAEPPFATPPAVAAVRDDERPPPPPPPRRRSSPLVPLAFALVALLALAFWWWSRRDDAPAAVAEGPRTPPPVAAVAPDSAALAADSVRIDTVAGDGAVAEAPPEPEPESTPPPAPERSAPPRTADARPATPPPGRPTPAPAQPAPPAPEPERPAPEPAAGPNPFRGPGEVDPSAGGATWIVNSTTAANARMQADRYRSQGLRASALSAVVGGRTVWRVAVGQFGSVDEAERARAHLPADARADAWIFRLGR